MQVDEMVNDGNKDRLMKNTHILRVRIRKRKEMVNDGNEGAW